MPPLLSIEQLQISLAGRTIVRDVSFQLQAGQILGIIGESGSGKSLTCLGILGLLAGATVQGQIQLGDRDLGKLTRREWQGIRGKRIGLILQNPASFFNPIATIHRQFCHSLQTHRALDATAATEKAIAQLAAVGLTQPERVLQQYPFQLSGGMLQRVMIAIALALEPEVLIADEPTTALDVITQMQILRLIQQLQQQTQCAILLVTHDLGVIAQMADTVAVMRQGEFVEQAAVTTIFENPQHSYTRSLLAARLLARSEASP
jgi:ABC-type dipeptide/oligopeptide/nickel transport system ATPase component